MDQQVIHAFAGVGGVSVAYFGWKILQSVLTGMADRREAKAAEISTAAAHQEEQESRINALEELLKLKALPAPDPAHGAGAG